MNKQSLSDEIETVKNQLIEKFRPNKIILFGSCAKGIGNSNSDLDFLVIKDDPRRSIEVEQELHRIIDYRFASDFIVLTPSEFNKRLRMGDFFIQEIMRTGKTLYG